MRRFSVVALVAYFVLAGLAAFVGFYDPPGQTGCDVAWCGMIGFLAVFGAGLPWSLLVLLSPSLLASNTNAYWACWLCIALNIVLLSLFARHMRRSAP